jgi:pyruvate formate lyase activating enzyme
VKGSELRVGGVVAFTTVDFPGRLAAVVFCQGCPWRCGYCHNPHLQDFRPGTISWLKVRSFLIERQGLLEAVVFSGGEPLAQPALAAAMKEVRELGFKVGLHTAGSHVRRLEQVIPLLDWVGLDIKAPAARYREITGAGGASPAYRCLGMLIAAGVPYQVRTTLDARLGSADLRAMREELHAVGATGWVLQDCRGSI